MSTRSTGTRSSASRPDRATRLLEERPLRGRVRIGSVSEPSHRRGRSLLIQPQGSGTTAVVEGLVGGIVLHIRLPAAGERVGVRVYIVLLLRFIPLKLVYDLLAGLQVLL